MIKTKLKHLQSVPHPPRVREKRWPLTYETEDRDWHHRLWYWAVQSNTARPSETPGKTIWLVCTSSWLAFRIMAKRSLDRHENIEKAWHLWSFLNAFRRKYWIKKGSMRMGTGWGAWLGKDVHTLEPFVIPEKRYFLCDMNCSKASKKTWRVSSLILGCLSQMSVWDENTGAGI